MNPIKISVIIVVRNEANYIVECIKSIERQFSSYDWELLIVDGCSEDNTLQLATEYLKDKHFSYKFLKNIKKTLAPGWNLGISEARGNFVIRPDAHATLHPDYIQKGVEFLETHSEITAVGGILETKARTNIGQVIKIALSSRIGVGNSSFRTGVKSGITDTAVYAVYRKAIFKQVGLFNESLVRHQDNDMHNRIKAVGGKFYLNTEMQADYYCRDSIKKLSAQMFNIGKYLPDVMLSGALSLRHFIPAPFYLCIIMGSILGIWIKFIGWLTGCVFMIYLLLILGDCISNTIKLKKIDLLLNLFIIPLIHFCYAAGTFWGVLKRFI